MLRDDQPIDLVQATLLISSLQDKVERLTGRVTSLQGILLQPSQGEGIPANSPQAVNQIRNGTFSHSTNSWNNTPGANNGQRECAWYYSHPIQPGQPMFKENYASPYQTLTLGTVTGSNITITDHFLMTGTAVRFSGSIPTPLAPSTTYYVIPIDANTIRVAATLEDAIKSNEITLTNTATGGLLIYSYTLKSSNNDYYSEHFADWDIATGSARFTNPLTDISCFLPGNNIEAGYSYYAVFSIVRMNPYVFASPSCRIFAGLYGYSTSQTQWNWLNAPYVITGQPLGTINTPTEREYLVFVETDRGVTIATSPLLITDTPSDADFGGGATVFLRWPRPLSFGVTSYAIYRRTPTEFDPSDVDTGTDEITITAHGLTTGQPIRFTNSGGGLPAPLSASTVYYAIRINANVFQVAASVSDATNGIEIDLTTAGTGSHFLQVYVRLNTISGISFLDNGGFQAFATGYPTADYNELIAYTASVPNVVATLPYSGDPLFNGWAVLPFAIRVPQNYDKGDTDLTLGQWLRWGLTEELNLRIVNDITATFNDNEFISTVGQFETNMIRKTAVVQDKAGNVITGTVTNVSGINSIQLDTNWTYTTDTNATITIEGGAPAHSLFIDLAHLTYSQGAAFSPNPEDISPDRGIPTAVPNGTTQGPIIIGQLPGNSDGTPVCLYQYETVVTETGEIFAHELRLGMRLPNGHGSYNTLVEMKSGVSDVWRVTTENGASLLCTDTKLIYVGLNETKMLAQLQKGDTILTVENGVIVEASILNIEKVLTKQIVVQIGLSPGHSFLAGTSEVKVLVDNNKPLPPIELPPVI
ncbi:hypothetical protein [Geitlerinema calcuttense]|uniref:Uncharacterized protein n=1 Tax=Geitlerinema calcuttense NRMC-F 0142 TaxID=2922238 RepID=A0ABT7LV24_9CYAN|nr:hypothetical protein [Geitlerinema calcuttense]MDL5055899.1 hypothetical protein [Geitlerinema calcuttense NRMC-F 0142]